MVFAGITVFFCFGCKKEKGSCVDESLKHNQACTTDCPGVQGCDGKTYCNECEANRVGIRVVK